MSHKKMDIKEFCGLGLLQEVNRLFFHPMGLALEVTADKTEDGGFENYNLSGIWDHRDDPEGIFFQPEILANPKAFDRMKRVAQM